MIYFFLFSSFLPLFKTVMQPVAMLFKHGVILLLVSLYSTKFNSPSIGIVEIELHNHAQQTSLHAGAVAL